MTHPHKPSPPDAMCFLLVFPFVCGVRESQSCVEFESEQFMKVEFECVGYVKVGRVWSLSVREWLRWTSADAVCFLLVYAKACGVRESQSRVEFGCEKFVKVEFECVGSVNVSRVWSV